MNLPFLTPPPPPAFGLDLSPSGIKFVQLRRRKKTTIIDVAGGFPFPNEAISEGKITNPELLSQHIKSALEPYAHQLVTHVVTSLPESITFLQRLDITKNGQQKLDERLREVLPEYMPLPLEETIYDVAIIEETSERWRVVVGAAPKEAVETYLQILEGAGLVPIILDIEAPAIARAAIHETEHVPTTAVVDLGRSHAALLYLDQGLPQFTVGLPAAGESIIAAAAQALHTTAEESEKAIIACGDNPSSCPAPLASVIDAASTELANRITQAQSFYADHDSTARPIERVILCGGGAQLGLLMHDLQSKLSIPVIPADPWHGIAGTPPPSPLGYITAIGLALRALESKAL